MNTNGTIVAGLGLPLQRAGARRRRHSRRSDGPRQPDHGRRLRSDSDRRAARAVRRRAPLHAARQLRLHADRRRADVGARRRRRLLRPAAGQHHLLVGEPAAVSRRSRSTRTATWPTRPAAPPRRSRRWRASTTIDPEPEHRAATCSTASACSASCWTAISSRRRTSATRAATCCGSRTSTTCRSTCCAANNALPAAQRPSENALRPYKGYSAIQQRRSEASSNYNGLQLYFTKRRGDFTFTLGYTLSKVDTDASGFGDNPLDNDLAYNYGPASYDRRHVFVSTWTYRVPFLRERRDFLGQALGGWEVSGITRFQSGQYLLAHGQHVDRRPPRRLRCPARRFRSTTADENEWFNTAAFVAAPNDRRGTAAVGVIEGPGVLRLGRLVPEEVLDHFTSQARRAGRLVQPVQPREPE